MSAVRSVILGSGGYLPDKILTNAELAKTVDTSDAWIRQRTGISERRIAAEGELTSDLAVAAAREALAASGLTALDIDMIILATSTEVMYLCFARPAAELLSLWWFVLLCVIPLSRMMEGATATSCWC